MWVNLHNEWYRIKKINGQTIWAMIVMLFFSSLFPYATSIVAENFNNVAAQSFYGIVVILITVSNLISYRVLTNYNKNDSEVLEQMKARNRWLVVDIMIKIVGLAVAMTIFPPAMMYAVLLTLIVLVIPNQIEHIRKSR